LRRARSDRIEKRANASGHSSSPLEKGFTGDGGRESPSVCSRKALRSKWEGERGSELMQRHHGMGRNGGEEWVGGRWERGGGALSKKEGRTKTKCASHLTFGAKNDIL